MRRLHALRVLPLLATFFPLRLCLAQSEPEETEDDPYADSPFWYQPGHSVNPADAASISSPEGFVVEKIFDIPEAYGSWTALCAMPDGQLIAAAQHREGLYRITLPPLSEPDAKASCEAMQGAAAKMGWSHGLLHAFGGLYVTIAEASEERQAGVYRLDDHDTDGQYESSKLLFSFEGTGEHGPHNIVVGPDGKSLYLIAGNGTPPPTTELPTLSTTTNGIERLNPPGFSQGRYTTGGFILRFDPDGSNRQIICSGMRNAFDLAFNLSGDLFTFDSDMEWDLGTPWYRPTRIYQLVTGGEYGWREGGANFPEHYEDTVAPVLDIGPGSPTGMTFGYQANFPAKYKSALFVCDWTFATLHAIHLKPEGGSYSAEFEEFVAGAGLPLTDLVIASDGAMYFLVGGRRLGSALYRVRYLGEEPIPNSTEPGPLAPENQRRREIEAYIENSNTTEIDRFWKDLDSPDRSIRFAARIALEKQEIAKWRTRALAETDPASSLTALLALARQGNESDLESILSKLASHTFWKHATSDQSLAALRIVELCLGRASKLDPALKQQLSAALESGIENLDSKSQTEALRLLAFLGEAKVIEASLERMRNDTGERRSGGLSYFARNPKYGKAIRDMLESAPLIERMLFAKNLLWIAEGWTQDQRIEYFQLIDDAIATSKGGHMYQDFWLQIRETALAQIDEAKRAQILSSLDSPLASNTGTSELPKPHGPGRAWTVKDALQVMKSQSLPRNFDQGKRSFAAASCITCHRIGGEGGSIGPDLSALGQRFTPKDVLESIVNPSEAISDQYQMAILTTQTGDTYSGRVLSRDAQTIRIATNQLRPTLATELETSQIASESVLPVSTMPSGLLNGLNEDELLDLMAYLLSGGDPTHPMFN